MPSPTGAEKCLLGNTADSQPLWVTHTISPRVKLHQQQARTKIAIPNDIGFFSVALAKVWELGLGFVGSLINE
jgi:hypothetical protein